MLLNIRIKRCNMFIVNTKRRNLIFCFIKDKKLEYFFGEKLNTYDKELMTP